MPTSDPALPVAVSPLPAAPVRQRHTLVSLATRQNGSPLDSDIKAAASTWPANLAGWRVKGDASFWPCKCRTGAAFFICTQLLRPRFFFLARFVWFPFARCRSRNTMTATSGRAAAPVDVFRPTLSLSSSLAAQTLGTSFFCVACSLGLLLLRLWKAVQGWCVSTAKEIETRFALIILSLMRNQVLSVTTKETAA
jgi:hypothetical protein